MPVNCCILYLLTIVAIHNNTLGLIGHENGGDILPPPFYNSILSIGGTCWQNNNHVDEKVVYCNE